MSECTAEQIADYMEDFLHISQFDDASFNGIQVMGTSKAVKKIVTGVTADLAFIQKASKAGADMLLVHHGIFWKGADPRLTGWLGNRVKALDGMTLVACHLPLDAHEEIGNNALLLKAVGGETCSWYPHGQPSDITMVGCLKKETTVMDLQRKLSVLLNHSVMVMGPVRKNIRKIAVCTGAGGFVLDDDQNDFDALITGEVHEQHWHLAQEKGISVFVCGHHATERAGIKALGENIARKFGIEHEFIDVPCPL